ncbi:MAG: alginate export family protein [Planctomycetes bacterium]|nr:alginate export family protein [Planctomycetota bacterium]
MIPDAFHRAAAAAALLLVTAPLALARQDAADEGRPAYQFLRQREDWSAFRAASPARDLFDPLKHVALSDDGDVWLSVGGRAEARLESWRGFNFGAPPTANHDDEFLLSRLLVHGDLHAGEHLRVFVEGKTAQSTERDLPGGRRDLDFDSLDLQQAFVDVDFAVGDGRLLLRPGRQMLQLGAQRLVSPLPWGNSLRTWEGLTAEYRQGPWTITGLATAYVPVDQTDFNDRDDDTLLYGVYAHRAPAQGGRGLELYALGNTRDSVTVNGTSGDERRETFGARSWGPISGPFDYEVEGAWQIGEVGDGDVSAWFLAAQAGWRAAELAGKPRFWLGLDFASGDSAPGGDVGTFHQLFPLGHAYFGFIDAIGRQNIQDTSAGAKWSLDAQSHLALGLHAFRLMDTDDALYNAGGAPYRTGFSSKEVGYEVDVLVDRSFGRHLAAYAGYSHLFAGDAIRESGPDDDVDFLYLGARYTF